MCCKGSVVGADPCVRPVQVMKLTPFQRSVYKATLEIPLGETRSYQWVARRIGKPKAVRAVGQALKRNPYPLIIPCHRVVCSDGKLGSYCGKNDGRKKELLDLERVIQRTLFSNISSSP